jgi:hypothetical protein
MTPIIRAAAAHDFLALVPVLAGYRPTRSLVCVAFEGNRTTAVLRHDLPDAARRDIVAGALLGTLCRIPRIDAIVPIAYGETPFDGGRLPHGELLECVVRRAEEAGFVVRDALTVAPDGWGSWFDDDLPAGGRDLRLIEASAAVGVASRAGAVVDEDLPESAADLVRIPAADEAFAGPIREILDGLAAERRTAGPAPGALAEASDLVERALGDAIDPVVLVERIAAGRAEAIAAESAWLLELSEQPSIRDGMMLQAAFGPLVGELALDSAEEAGRRRFAERDVAASGGGTSARVPAVPAEDETVDGFLARLMLGRTTIRPDAERVRATLDVLATAIGNAPEGRRTGALCIAAWLAWALGRGSAAGALIDLALAETPQHTMAGLLHRFLGLGELPDWAFSSPLPGPDDRVDAPA